MERMVNIPPKSTTHHGEDSTVVLLLINILELAVGYIWISRFKAITATCSKPVLLSLKVVLWPAPFPKATFTSVVIIDDVNVNDDEEDEEEDDDEDEGEDGPAKRITPITPTNHTSITRVATDVHTNTNQFRKSIMKQMMMSMVIMIKVKDSMINNTGQVLRRRIYICC